MKTLHRLLSSLVLAAGTFAASSVTAADVLVPPPGYQLPVLQKKASGFSCPIIGAPFTATLDFPSKYEGSGKARDAVNDSSEREYKEKTKPINDTEKGIVKAVDKYLDTGEPAALKCALDGYLAWSGAHALLGEAANHTGKSIRKWTLASLAGAYLRLKFSASQPLAAYPEQAKQIEAWFGQIADRVVTEWNEDDPLQKINNHYYWAAWSVMATSVILNRRDLFDWSTKMYAIFAKQVDADGYLPNELARQTRALGYHSYALTPLTIMAAFGKANGINLAAAGDNALQRVGERTLQGLADPTVFEKKTGSQQIIEGLDDSDSKLAWLEPYCWTVGCSAAAAEKAASMRPMKNTRLGGDVSREFAQRP
ncbi:MAG: algL [Nevskia sp.]|nr:algL [Nevskia sp.]